jgi:hypothetical protein
LDDARNEDGSPAQDLDRRNPSAAVAPGAVPSRSSLADLHRTIQEAFGWMNCHLHEFTIDGVRYGIDDGEGWGDPPRDERKARLSKVAPVGGRFK